MNPGIQIICNGKCKNKRLKVRQKYFMEYTRSNNRHYENSLNIKAMSTFKWFLKTYACKSQIELDDVLRLLIVQDL